MLSLVNEEAAMKPEQAVADVELRHGGRAIRVKALVDAGASKNIMSKRLSDRLGAFAPLERPSSSGPQIEGGG